MKPVTAAVLTTYLFAAIPVLAQTAQQRGPQPTWDTIAQIIQAETEEGFSGAVLLIKDGEIFLNQGYGMADRDAGAPNTADTIFATGSTPIDFTLVSLLQLVASGVVSLDDPISKFFDGIPQDRNFMTLDDIRRSASGLPDFPFLQGVDEDPDHTPLTRDEFIDRVRTAKLLFEPGTGREHSHFAWGLLAAVIEVASGKTYQRYVQENILDLAGMTRTGFNGQQFPNENVALGYGFKSWGPVNTPPQWGPTSWLIMGSGGMVGTTGDLYKFNLAINDGALVPGSVIHLYPSRGVYANGDMYGFETVYNFGGDNLFYINCNSSNLAGGYSLEPLANKIEQLCSGRQPARFTIGIALGRGEIHPEVAEVFSGSPAETAGFQAGDILISANGAPIDLDDPLAALRPGIEQGRTLNITVTRNGQTLNLKLVPTPREP